MSDYPSNEMPSTGPDPRLATVNTAAPEQTLPQDDPFVPRSQRVRFFVGRSDSESSSHDSDSYRTSPRWRARELNSDGQESTARHVEDWLADTPGDAAAGPSETQDAAPPTQEAARRDISDESFVSNPYEGEEPTDLFLQPPRDSTGAPIIPEVVVSAASSPTKDKMPGGEWSAGNEEESQADYRMPVSPRAGSGFDPSRTRSKTI